MSWLGTQRPARRIALGGLGLAALVIVLVAGGCDDEEGCPICPESSIKIEEIQLFPPAVTIGDTLQLWATTYGSDLEFSWVASHGRFLEIDGSWARWKAPDTPVIVSVSVVAYNAEESDAHTQEIPVAPYDPRHTPTYTGAGYCGLECHSISGHGSHYEAWAQSAHAAAYGEIDNSSRTTGDCAACHAVGYGDTDERGWDIHNGGFDETPILELQGVQCENCHGALADAEGTILDEHGELALGDFVLETCAGCHSDPLIEFASDIHAPQAQLLAGEGGYEYEQILESTPHATQVPRSCVTCHYPVYSVLGSHTFAADPPSCAACHAEAGGGDFDWSAGMAEVDDLLRELKVELALATEDDKSYYAYEWALRNATLVEKDGSSGAHNYAYAKALLELSIENFEPSAR